MKWKARDKEAKSRKQMLFNKLAKIETRRHHNMPVESVEEFLARGGKITKIKTKKH